MSWKKEIKKEYGMPDNRSRFDRLGDLQVMIDNAIDVAEKLGGDDLKEARRHLVKAVEIVFEITDKLM